MILAYAFLGMDNEETSDDLHATFKENAMFLLDLASTSGRRSADGETYLKSDPWTVSNEFKCLGNLQISGKHSDVNDAILLELQDRSLGVSDGYLTEYEDKNKMGNFFFFFFCLGIAFGTRRGGRDCEP